jgi:hypothetical protein
VEHAADPPLTELVHSVASFAEKVTVPVAAGGRPFAES